MEQHKAWHWKKKSSEKNGNVVATTPGYDRNLVSKVPDEEVQYILSAKADFEIDLKRLNEKLASALIKCDAKDELVMKHANVAEEAFAGWEKAESIAVSLKQELDIALQKKVSAEERLMHFEAALKDCVQQLRHVRDEQEKRINDAVGKTTREFEKTKMALEEELAEAKRKLGKSGFENTHLTKALLVKEKLNEDLNEQKIRAEVEYKALMAKISFLEKDNASLTYEVRVLEKELDIRNEEKEFNRRTGDASHKQHLVSAKKITKLESECQRLRLHIQTRLLGPASMAKMKNEVETMGRDSPEIRRNKLNTSPVGLRVDFNMDNSADYPTTRITLLTEQVRVVEAENKILKENLSRKIDELQVSRATYARTATKDKPTTDITREILLSREYSLASLSDFGSDDRVSCSDSWGSALISEIEYFKNGKQKRALSCNNAGVSDITLMDDFAEMEKLAIVSADKPFRRPYISSDEINTPTGPLETMFNGTRVPESDCQSEISVSNSGIRFEDISNVPEWTQGIIKSILEQTCVLQKNPYEILEDIRAAMSYMNTLDAAESTDVKERSKRVEKCNPQIQLSLRKSISKIIDLIEGINLPSSGHDNPVMFSPKNIEAPAGYMVRVFQWKTSELHSVVQHFIDACNDLLNGNADLEKFSSELTSSLEWIMNHCFSLQDVSSMRDEIRKHYGWDDTRSESEAETGVRNSVESTSFTVWNNSLNCFPATEAPCNIREENMRIKKELIFAESSKKNLEGKLKNQLLESEKTIANLQTELQSLVQSKGLTEDQAENQNMINEDLDTQLTIARVQLTEARQKIASVEIELENKNNCCEELEAMCLELQLQQGSVVNKENPSHDIKREEKHQQADGEISTATKKLAECQETIQSLGKQLKAMASTRETSPNKVTSSPSHGTSSKENTNQHRSSLLDQMLADDNTETNNLKSPNTKEIVCSTNSEKNPPPLMEEARRSGSGSGLYGITWSPKKSYLGLNKIKQHEDRDAVVLSIPNVPPAKKQKGGGLWRKLCQGRMKGNNKKQEFHLCA